MKVSRKSIYNKSRALPRIRFEEQQLTSFSGLIVFQQFFAELGLKDRLSRCFRSINDKNSHYYSYESVFRWLIVHILLGYSKLRDSEFYKKDPIVLRTLGMDLLPSVPTASRMLRKVDDQSIDRLQEDNMTRVLERLKQEGPRRITLDFDGSVLSTRRHAEGSAVGFNKTKKGARSYYPLFCVLALTGQVLDVLHRSGNVHDSNGALEFVAECIVAVRNALPKARLEVRLDSAFFSDEIITLLEELEVQYTISVPFERFTELKGFIEKRNRWQTVRGTQGKQSCFERKWSPKSWKAKRRFVFIRTRSAVQRKGPLQLELFEPVDHRYEFKVIVTNKQTGPRNITSFHEGRGGQESVYAELKSHAAMGYVPAKKWAANKTFLLANIYAHNLTRELQLRARAEKRCNYMKQTAGWVFETMDSLRRKMIQRAGRLTRPKGNLTLTLSHNPAVESLFNRFLST